MRGARDPVVVEGRVELSFRRSSLKMRGGTLEERREGSRVVEGAGGGGVVVVAVLVLVVRGRELSDRRGEVALVVGLREGVRILHPFLRPLSEETAVQPSVPVPVPIPV